MITPIILLGILIRLGVALYPYSGQNTPPMFGDFEAQRHWMEITYNLPTKDWYFHTLENDLMYWGLDYPPLTAYHSWLCGYVASAINSSYVELKYSRGLESEGMKLFMRSSVLIADVVTFIPAIVLFYWLNKSIGVNNVNEFAESTKEIIKLSCLLSLIYPGIILIDHGHFQYNCVSLGLFIYAVCAVTKERYISATVLFCFALLYKQMELYHALPFFFYFLGICFSIFKKHGIFPAFHKLVYLGMAVTLTFLVVCFPFITSSDKAFQLFKRLFPIARGVFEDKVANLWCVVNIIYKLRLLISNEEMAKVCFFSTCVSVVPSLYDLFINQSLTKFKYSLVNSALAFYLFSYQVHEKTILLVAVPVLLVMPYDPLPCFWFLCISVFSMLPLFFKDNLLLPYTALSILFVLTFESYFVKKVTLNKNITKNSVGLFQLIKCNLLYLYYLSLFGCTFLTVVFYVMKPPKRYPDIFPLIISVYSCFHFIGFLVYFNVKQRNVKELRNKKV